MSLKLAGGITNCVWACVGCR